MNLSFHPEKSSSEVDKTTKGLLSLSKMMLLLVCGLLPILFLPSPYVPFSAGKVYIVTAVVTLALLFYVMSVLKTGGISLRLPLPVIAVWTIAIVTTISAVFSGDRYDALWGNGFDSYTAFFAILMAILVTAMGIFSKSQASIIRLYAVIIVSGLIISLFHIIRLVFGPEALSFGVWTGSTFSLIGSWNGLAIFYGLVIILSLLALQQLSLSKFAKYIVLAVTGISLLMLAIINFSSVWWVLGGVSGLVILYSLVKNLWNKKESAVINEDTSYYFVASIVILVLSIVFLVGGSRLGGVISDRLGVNFIEVRPSALATLEIGRAVSQDSLWLGSGPNRFADSWRLHKDQSINQTIFWNAQFDSGYSYVTTAIIGTGLLGALAWVFFLGTLIWSGFRFLFNGTKLDRHWYFIGLSSLVAAVYFWLMSIIYVPPPSLMLLAAVTTGLFIVAYTKSVPGKVYTISVENNRNYGFVLIALAVLVVVGSGYGLYAASKHVAGVYTFNKVISTVSEGDTLESVEEGIAQAFDLTPNDIFAREIAFYRLSEMSSLLAVSEPGVNEQQAFTTAAERAIQAGQLAVNLDPTDPANHQVLGQIYAILAVVGLEGAAERAGEAFNNVKLYDPVNPVPYLLEADLAAAQGDIDRARTSAEQAVVLRPNYTEALFFLAQIDINQGDIERAIAIVSGVAQLEPQNPARRYQLGLLLSSSGRLDEAVSAFEQAVSLDPQYANARYLLALGYAEQGRVEDAIEQLTIVRDLSEENRVVDGLIEELRTNGSLPESITNQETVSERDTESGNVTESDLENDLVTSSNPIPEQGQTQ